MVRFGSSRSANRKSQGKTWRKAVQFANHAVRTVLHKGTVTVGPHALANARTQSERDGSTQLPCGLAAWLDGWMARSQLAERCPRASKTVSAWPAQVISRISPFYLLVRTWPELCLCVARSVSLALCLGFDAAVCPSSSAALFPLSNGNSYPLRRHRYRLPFPHQLVLERSRLSFSRRHHHLTLAPTPLFTMEGEYSSRRIFRPLGMDAVCTSFGSTPLACCMLVTAPPGISSLLPAVTQRGGSS